MIERLIGDWLQNHRWGYIPTPTMSASARTLILSPTEFTIYYISKLYPRNAVILLTVWSFLYDYVCNSEHILNRILPCIQWRPLSAGWNINNSQLFCTSQIKGIMSPTPSILQQMYLMKRTSMVCFKRWPEFSTGFIHKAELNWWAPI